MIRSQIKQVEEFHITFGHPVLNLGEVPSIEQRKLRLKLIFEELSELAEAYGLEGSFVSICSNHIQNIYFKTLSNPIGKDTEIFNPTEALDATCDLLVVTNGAACINGHSSVIDEAFDETMRSNMSKVCNTLDEAQASVAEYHRKGINTEHKVVNGKYAIYNIDTGKILKSTSFQKPDYDKLLNIQ